MLTRREFIERGARASALALLAPYGCRLGPGDGAGTVVNDIHSQLNATRVSRIDRPTSLGEMADALRRAERIGRPVSIAGGRHSMGGQQFCADSALIDMNRFNRVRAFDDVQGLVEAEAGIQWPQLIEWLLARQAESETPWGIRQKQTGADRLSLGGALASNIHSRGLSMKPIIGDVESFTLMGPGGEIRNCSRSENAELFNLAIGGYGLFGIIVTVTLRLAPRTQVKRVVELIEVESLMAAFDKRKKEGFEFGDFQFSTDDGSDDFLEKGVFSCYLPLDKPVDIPEKQKSLSEADWRELLYFAHADKKAGFDAYANHYKGTSGQIYWSDTHQLSTYIDDYHVELDRRLGARTPGTEMITEIYVPRDALAPFLRRVRKDFRKNKVSLIYGTIRLIERDDESYLAWAKRPYACTIFNLHVDHGAKGIEKAEADFRRLIDRAIGFDGSYFLTYHRWATRQQVTTCYPQFGGFLTLKRAHDPQERFQSDWYRHYQRMFAARV